MTPERDSALFEEIDLGRDFPDIEDIEGYVEQIDYYDRTKTVRTHFFRLGNTMSKTFVSCVDVDCEGVYYVKNLIALAYVSGKKHLEDTLPCFICKKNDRNGDRCKAKFSIDIKYKMPAQEPKEGNTIPSPEDRFDQPWLVHHEDSGRGRE